MRTKLVLALWALAVLALASGCVGEPCQTDDDCGGNLYCNKRACDAPEGVCSIILHDCPPRTPLRYVAVTG